MFSDQLQPTDKLKPKLDEDKSDKASDNVARFTDMLEQKSNMQDVAIADLPDPEGISGPEDFTKYSAESLQSGIEKLEKMKPIIDSGVGDNSDYWREYDAAHGLSVPDGYQIVYDSYYGGEHIRVEKFGDDYDIINGRHRIWLAKQMGVESLPMEVVDVQRDK